MDYVALKTEIETGPMAAELAQVLFDMQQRAQRAELPKIQVEKRKKPKKQPKLSPTVSAFQRSDTLDLASFDPAPVFTPISADFLSTIRSMMEELQDEADFEAILNLL